MFPLFFPVSWLVLLSLPQALPYLPLNLVSVSARPLTPLNNVLSVCLSDFAGLGGSSPGEAKVGPGLSDSK